MVVRVVVPVTEAGMVDPRWGRAERVAIGTVDGTEISDWQEFAVGWDVLHDSGTEGAHHARVARFVAEHEVSTVVAQGMGGDMARMLEKLGLEVRLGVTGEARAAVRSVGA